MPSRRAHTNSHHGCLQCKAKRVKCDQAQPKCTRCEKRKSECTYRHLMTSYNPFQQTPRRTAASNTTPPTFVKQEDPTPVQQQLGLTPNLRGTVIFNAQSARGSTAPPVHVPRTVASHSAPQAIPSTTSPHLLFPAGADYNHYQRRASDSVAIQHQQGPGIRPLLAPHHFEPLGSPALGYHPPKIESPSPQPLHATISVSEVPYTQAKKDVSSFLNHPRTAYPIPSSKQASPVGFIPTSTTILEPHPYQAVSQALPAPETPDLSDGFLYEHYIKNLSVPRMSPVLESEYSAALNNLILAHAETVPYVRHVVLCFSALHLASTNASSTTPTWENRDSSVRRASTGSNPQHYHYLSTALAHKDSALQLFLPAIQEGITPTSAEPLLAASAVLVACEFGLPAADPSQRTAFDRVDILAQIAGLLQGTSHILRVHPLPQGPPSIMSSPSETEASFPVSSQGIKGENVPWNDAVNSVQQYIQFLNELPPIDDKEETNRRFILSQAASKLRKIFTLVSTAQLDFSVLCSWLGMIKPGFVTLVRAKDPLALVLLAHWAVCRTNMEGIWWAKGWPMAATEAIHEAVANEYRPLLRWCMEQAHRSESSNVYTATATTQY